MGFFSTLRRHSTEPADASVNSVRPVASSGSLGTVGVPLRFEAIGEALAAGAESLSACEEVGRSLARDGVSLAEAMDGLRMTVRAVLGADPSYDSLQAMLVAWSEATLAHLHQISCEDPLTGLASRAHVRSRIAELQRARTGAGDRYALVVLDERPSGLEYLVEPAGALGRSLRLASLAETARTVFVGQEVIARIAPDRIVVLVERDERLAKRVGLLRRMLNGTGEGHRTRVWVEGLPGNARGAAALLDDLARS